MVGDQRRTSDAHDSHAFSAAHQRSTLGVHATHYKDAGLAYEATPTGVPHESQRATEKPRLQSQATPPQPGAELTIRKRFIGPWRHLESDVDAIDLELGRPRPRVAAADDDDDDPNSWNVKCLYIMDSWGERTHNGDQPQFFFSLADHRNAPPNRTKVGREVKWIHLGRQTLTPAHVDAVFRRYALPGLEPGVDRLAEGLLRRVFATQEKNFAAGYYLQSTVMRYDGKIPLDDDEPDRPCTFLSFPYLNLAEPTELVALPQETDPLRRRFPVRSLLQSRYRLQITHKKDLEQSISTLTHREVNTCVRPRTAYVDGPAKKKCQRVIQVHQMWCLSLSGDTTITYAPLAGPQLHGQTISMQRIRHQEPTVQLILDDQRRQKRFNYPRSSCDSWFRLLNKHREILLSRNLFGRGGVQSIHFELYIDDDTGQPIEVTWENWLQILQDNTRPLLEIRLQPHLAIDSDQLSSDDGSSDHRPEAPNGTVEPPAGKPSTTHKRVTIRINEPAPRAKMAGTDQPYSPTATATPSEGKGKEVVRDAPQARGSTDVTKRSPSQDRHPAQPSSRPPVTSNDTDTELLTSRTDESAAPEPRQQRKQQSRLAPYSLHLEDVIIIPFFHWKIRKFSNKIRERTRAGRAEIALDWIENRLLPKYREVLHRKELLSQQEHRSSFEVLDALEGLTLEQFHLSVDATLARPSSDSDARRVQIDRFLGETSKLLDLFLPDIIRQNARGSQAVPTRSAAIHSREASRGSRNIPLPPPKAGPSGYQQSSSDQEIPKPQELPQVTNAGKDAPKQSLTETIDSVSAHAASRNPTQKSDPEDNGPTAMEDKNDVSESPNATNLPARHTAADQIIQAVTPGDSIGTPLSANAGPKPPGESVSPADKPDEKATTAAPSVAASVPAKPSAKIEGSPANTANPSPRGATPANRAVAQSSDTNAAETKPAPGTAVKASARQILPALKPTSLSQTPAKRNTKTSASEPSKSEIAPSKPPTAGDRARRTRHSAPAPARPRPDIPNHAVPRRLRTILVNVVTWLHRNEVPEEEFDRLLDKIQAIAETAAYLHVGVRSLSGMAARAEDIEFGGSAVLQRTIVEAFSDILCMYFGIWQSLWARADYETAPDAATLSCAMSCADASLEKLIKARDDLIVEAGEFEKDPPLGPMVTPEAVIIMLLDRLSQSVQSIGTFDVAGLYERVVEKLAVEVQFSARPKLLFRINKTSEEIDIIRDVLRQQERVLLLYRRSLNPETFSPGKAGVERTNKFPYEERAIDEILRAVRDRLSDFDELKDRTAQLRTQNVQLVEIEHNSNNRAILVFTVVTIIFLPLTFVSSYFGMNLKGDVTNTQHRFWTISGPLTALVGFPCLLLAFWPRTVRMKRWFVAWVLLPLWHGLVIVYRFLVSHEG